MIVTFTLCSGVFLSFIMDYLLFVVWLHSLSQGLGIHVKAGSHLRKENIQIFQNVKLFESSKQKIRNKRNRFSSFLQAATSDLEANLVSFILVLKIELVLKAQ